MHSYYPENMGIYGKIDQESEESRNKITLLPNRLMRKGTCDIMIIVLKNVLGDANSNSGHDCLPFSSY